MGTRRSLILACLALVAGLLLGCCFPPIDMTALAWVALVPLGFVLVAKRLNTEAWAGVYLGGLAYHLLALQWIGEIEASFSLLGIWSILSQVGAVLFCVCVWISRKVIRRFQMPICLGLPLYWVGFEYLRFVVAAAIDPSLAPWLRLGGTQVDWPLVAQVAAVGGEFALSLLVALFNGWVFHIIEFAISRKSATPVALHRTALLAPIGLILSVGYGWWCLESLSAEQGPTVVLLNKQDWLVDHDRSWSERVSTNETPKTPDLLVWPELSDHHKLVTGLTGNTRELPEDVQLLADVVSTDYASWYQERLSQAAQQSGASILIGCERIDLSEAQPKRYNSLVFADARGGFVGYGDKLHLVPLFEREAQVANWLGIPNAGGYLPGSVPPRFTLATETGKLDFACLVCYDIAFGYQEDEINQQGLADFYVHCGSEATDKSGVVSKTLLRMAKLRAIEARRPIIRNCHRGACGVIDHLARFTPRRVENGVAIPMTVPLNAKSSLDRDLRIAGYMGGGGLLVFACCLPLVRSTLGNQSQSKKTSRNLSSGFSLLELLAVVAILGTIAAVVLPRVTTTGSLAKEKADLQNRGIINAAVERFYLMEGDWPENDLSDIGANPDYFPQGIPLNPVTEQAYRLNPVTHRVQVGGGGGK